VDGSIVTQSTLAVETVVADGLADADGPTHIKAAAETTTPMASATERTRARDTAIPQVRRQARNLAAASRV
jgi:hypothetical protein